MNKIYEQDFNLWQETTAKLIRERKFDEVDWDNLLAELEDMGKSEKRAFTSNLMILIAHLLKLKVQWDAPDTMKESWYNSVIEHRVRVKKQLRENPSFNNYFHEAIKDVYTDARKIAIKQGKLASKNVRKPNENEYPMDCPFTIEQLLDDDDFGDC